MFVRNNHLTSAVPHEDLRAQVRLFRYVVHTEGRQGTTNASNNHATLYLVVGRDRSVQINMRHDDNDLNGRLEIIRRNYLVSNSEITRFDFAADDVPNVREVVDLILPMRDFCFSGGGMGCKYWHLVMTQQYEGQGWLASGSAVKLHEHLSYQFSRLRRPQAQTIIAGTFNDENAQGMANQSLQALGDAITEQARNMQALGITLDWLSRHLSLPEHQTQVNNFISRLATQGIVCSNQAAIDLQRARVTNKVETLGKQRRDLANTVTRLAALISQRQEEEDE